MSLVLTLIGSVSSNNAVDEFEARSVLYNTSDALEMSLTGLNEVLRAGVLLLTEEDVVPGDIDLICPLGESKRRYNKSRTVMASLFCCYTCTVLEYIIHFFLK